MTWLQQLSAAVRTERFAQKLSREQLGNLPGVSYNAVKHLELGLRWSSWQTFTSCLVALELSLSVERAQPAAPGPAGPSQAGKARGPRSSR